MMPRLPVPNGVATVSNWRDDLKFAIEQDDVARDQAGRQKAEAQLRERQNLDQCKQMLERQIVPGMDDLRQGFNELGRTVEVVSRPDSIHPHATATISRPEREPIEISVVCEPSESGIEAYIKVGSGQRADKYPYPNGFPGISRQSVPVQVSKYYKQSLKER